MMPDDAPEVDTTPAVSTTAGADQFDAWAELVAQNFVPLAIRPATRNQDFDGSLAASNYGDMHIGRVRATPHTVWRDQHHRDQGGSTDVKISLVLAGRLCLEQGDTVEVVEPGGAAMYNCGDEYRLRMDEPFSLLVLQTDRAGLEQRVASDLERAIVFAQSNMFARALWSVASELGPDLASAADGRAAPAIPSRSLATPPTSSPLLGDRMIDLLALAVAEQTGGRVSTQPGRRELYMRAVSHIGRHLADTQLSPRSIAAAIGVSQRTLHSLFREAGDSVMSFIIRQRLERAHAELIDPDRRGQRTITDIAVSWGFKSPSHFTRRFSEQYGTSPTEIRSAGRS